MAVQNKTEYLGGGYLEVGKSHFWWSRPWNAREVPLLVALAAPLGTATGDPPGEGQASIQLRELFTIRRSVNEVEVKFEVKNLGPLNTLYSIYWTVINDQ